MNNTIELKIGEPYILDIPGHPGFTAGLLFTLDWEKATIIQYIDNSKEGEISECTMPIANAELDGYNIRPKSIYDVEKYSPDQEGYAKRNKMLKDYGKIKWK